MSEERTLHGLAASPGIAIGEAWWYRRQSLYVERERTDSPEEDLQRLDEACRRALAELDDLIARRQEALSPDDLAIFHAQRLMVQDPDLRARVERAVRAGQAVERAWQEEIEQVAGELEALPDPYFQARAADIRDVGRRVLRHLLGVTEAVAFPDHPVVVLAEDLTPSDTVHMPSEVVLAFCTEGGGPTSHAAILARRQGIPAVVGIGPALGEVASEERVIVDGYAGVVIVHPTKETLARFHARQRHLTHEEEAARARATEEALTRDGTRVEVGANVGGPEDAKTALAAGAEGIGLLRTEFLYLERTTPPTEEEQLHVYRRIFHIMGNRPVVVRTLDVGGDKPLPYLPLPTEANPFLGVRAIRLARKHPQILHTQLRAILRAGVGHPVRIMFPMVATVKEMQWLRQTVEEVVVTLSTSGEAVPQDVQVGMMVEIPAAALLAEKFCPWIDFFSIGTNDLSQYTLAADRTNADVAALADGLHPAVLRLIKQVTDAARAAGKWVGVCGAIAGEEAAVPVLIGLGVNELSVAPSRVPLIKAEVRRWEMSSAREVAEKALEMTDAAEVRELCLSAGLAHRDRSGGRQADRDLGSARDRVER